jgi:hypothetical protein
LRIRYDYRMLVAMQKLTDDAVKQLGGTTAVADLVKAPVSTVHSWKRNGISASRLDHLKLAAQAAGKHIDWDKAVEPASEQEAA